MDKRSLEVLKNSIKVFDKVVLLPDVDMEWNTKALDFIQRLCKSEMRIKVYSVIEIPGYSAEIISKKQCEEWLDLYRMYEFSAEFVVLSYREPFGRTWKGLLDNGCLTKEQMVEAILS